MAGREVCKVPSATVLGIVFRSEKIFEVKDMTKMDDKEAYNRARKRVEAKLGFYYHLAVYVGVNIVLIIINLSTARESLWFKWPLIGWGIGLFFHALNVFVLSSGASIKERMIEKEMKKTLK
jgi:hypothetical protein